MIAGVKSHKNMGVIPLFFQITAFTFLQHMCTICVVICQYNRHYSWPERGLPLFLALMRTLVSYCVQVILSVKDKNIKQDINHFVIHFEAGGYIFLVLDTLTCVSNTNTYRAKMVALVKSSQFYVYNTKS